MEIKYLGHASFKIRGKSATVVTDPFDPSMVGLKWPSDVKACVVTISHEHPDHNWVGSGKWEVGSGTIIVRGPGEYEIKGVKIYGYPSFHDEKQGAERGLNTIYLIKIEGINIVHLGDLGQKLSDELVEELETVDVLMVPTGGIYTISPKIASSVVHQLEPSIVIPMHYKVSALTSSFEKLSTVEDFLKEMGKTAEPQRKLVVTKDKLPEETEVVVLE